jgi:glycerate 2-kinase
MKDHALAIFRAALAAADPVHAVRDHWNIREARYNRIFVVGAGKAAAAMAQEVERKLGNRIHKGLVNVKYGHTAKLQRIELNECGHPVPDEAGVLGAQRIAELATGAKEGDLVICLISGGASALLPLPVEGVSLAAKQDVTRRLLACGADIHEMNTVRKHLSRIKGGQLASIASPAKVIALILSDVIGDDLDVIGSGPTVLDASTVKDARAVLAKYGIESDAARFFRETPKPGRKRWTAENIVIGSNRQALVAAAKEARDLGYRTLLLASGIEGETREVARVHAAMAREILASGNPVKPPACLISGGETTVTLRGSGKGGRNQEFALAAAVDIAGLHGVTILSCGTDGTDGPTDAAGAIVDGKTAGKGVLEALANNNSYPYLQLRNALVITGPTHTNVMDIHIVLVN